MIMVMNSLETRLSHVHEDELCYCGKPAIAPAETAGVESVGEWKFKPLFSRRDHRRCRATVVGTIAARSLALGASTP